MSSQLTDYAENKLADFFRGAGLTLSANWYMALLSAASDSGFTELSGTGYARVAVARSLANFAGTQAPGSTLASSGTTHATSNNNDINWGDPAANWGTANYVGFFDASSGGNCWIYLPISAIAITIGSPNPVKVLAGALQFSLGLTGGCTDYLANCLVDLIFRAQAFAWPTTLYTALFTATPGNAGGGTEVSGGSYARGSLVPSTTSISGTQGAGSTGASTGSGGRVSNNSAVDYPEPTGNWGTIVAEALMDAASAGNMLFWGALTAARTVLTGTAAPSHAPDSIGLTLD